jgi:periplasmic divalent cation tolerance protein
LTPVIVVTTVGATFDATELARDLVERRLAACVNILDKIQSIYRWQGKVEFDTEKILLIKTLEESIPALRDAVFAAHPYDVPEFVVLPISRIEGPYRDWLIESVSAG